MGYRYIGSKSKIIDFVVNKIIEIVPAGSHITDLMTGTAAVALALRNKGFKVTAADVMTYSYHHARLALLLKKTPKFLAAKDFIEENTSHQPSLFPRSRYELIIEALNNVKPKKGYFWNEFSIEGNPKNAQKPRNYFSPKNAKKIDSVRKKIKELNLKSKLSSLEHSLLIHDLIMSVNDVANIAGTYGHYLSKLRGRAKHPFILKESNLEISNTNNAHKVMQGYAEDLAKNIRCDLCYIDPPYMKRQYAANYHIIETLAREDEPEAIGESGLRPWRDQYSNFCTKTKSEESWRTIIKEMKCKHFLVSYSEDGLMKIERFKKIFSDFGKVKVSTFKNKRFKSNESKLAPKLKEYLIHLQKF